MNMDYSSSSSYVNTSLDLNSNPAAVRFLDQTQENEVTRNIFELGMQLSVKQESGALVEEVNRLSTENKRLTEMLSEMCENYNTLRGHLVDYMNKNPEKELSPPKKRKSESSNNNSNGIGIHGNSETSSTDDESCKKPKEEVVKAKISRVYVKTEASDTSLVVKDGYQWRKYGQKVTRDNPCPRAYFKCSFAPSCSVKKKVQRSVEDQSVLVATYEGEHNHPNSTQMEVTSGSNQTLTGASLSSSGPSFTLEMTKSKTSNDTKISKPSKNLPENQQFLVEQMAASLTKDPNFTSALAAAISGRMSQHNPKW